MVNLLCHVCFTYFHSLRNFPIVSPKTDAPLAVTRIKKIIHLDENIAQCSNNAAFVIAVATVSNLSLISIFFLSKNMLVLTDKKMGLQEMFIRYLAEQGHNVVKSERKPRRNIQYRDLGALVESMENA